MGFCTAARDSAWLSVTLKREILEHFEAQLIRTLKRHECRAPVIRVAQSHPICTPGRYVSGHVCLGYDTVIAAVSGDGKVWQSDVQKPARRSTYNNRD